MIVYAGCLGDTNPKPSYSFLHQREDTVDRPPVSAEAVFDVLSHPLRRRLLAVLVERDEAVGLDQLLEAVEVPGSSDDPRGRAKIACVHTHLPRLDDVGFIEYDRDGRTVTTTVAIDYVKPYLQLAERHGSR